MIVGSNKARIDALDKVLGRPVFAGDKEIDGALYAVVYRSPRPHAWIKGDRCERSVILAGHSKGY